MSDRVLQFESLLVTSGSCRNLTLSSSLKFYRTRWITVMLAVSYRGILSTYIYTPLIDRGVGSVRRDEIDVEAGLSERIVWLDRRERGMRIWRHDRVTNTNVGRLRKVVSRRFSSLSLSCGGQNNQNPGHFFG